MEYLLAVGVAMFAGLFLSRLTSRFNLPDVTCYLVAGLLVGPLCLGRLGIPGLGFESFAFVEAMGLVSDTALGFIAFSIGSEFRITALRKTGRQATVIAIFQALSATILVDVTLLLLHLALGDQLPVSTCLLLGAIATATAPAATVMVINQYKAKGPLTDILLPIVALDDAVGLIVFAVSTGVAKALTSGSISLVSVLLNPTLEILLSLGMGAALGWIFSQVEIFFNSNSKRLSLAVAFVALSAGLSKLEISLGGGVEIGFSSLLVCMMCGTIFCNLCDFSEEIMFKTEQWTAPINVLFFVISGAELDLRLFAQASVVGIGAAYILSRSAGKILGASISSKFMGCDRNIRKYLGITLLPQAGVALGMTVTVAAQFGQEGAIIRNIVLFSVLIYELVGPLLTKMALTRAGEIRPKPTVKRAKT
ncbi:MAG TPA: cation:proton antiporter [Candidatus Faecousia intestinigallinarum]|nr:cation:proton antiporter [Candidatus Faecousia intestinigallinarum]